MTSTFRLTKAEFKKIFKRPSIYIMALMIVATIFASIYIFNPIEKVDSTIVYETAHTSQDYYNIFYNNDTETTQKGIDKVFSRTSDITQYYFKCNQRNLNLKLYFDNLNKKFDILDNEANPTLKNIAYEEYIQALNDFNTAYKDFSFIESYDYVQYTKGNTNFENGHYNDAIKNLLNYTNSSSASYLNANEFVQAYKTNDYASKLNTAYINTLDFVVTTFRILSKNINMSYYDYDGYVSKGAALVGDAELQRINLEKALNTMLHYISAVFENEYPIALINKTVYDNAVSVLQDALESIKITDTSNYAIQHSVRNKLKNINISNYFNDFADQVYMVNIDNNLIESFNDINKIVNKNKSKILDKIDSLRAEESTKNISNAITEYYLLSTTYQELISDKVLYSISTNHSQDIYTNFFNYKFDEFNEYRYRENITKNKYYIDNNIYENSFLSNFYFNQNSGKTTNVYDFMYVAMEACTLVIIVFAMMLMCNLITSETESGTIKLLLVRPYKRSKIITAKFLATLFFVLTFVLFSALITFVGGYYLFGLPTQDVLVIFNSTTPFVLSPLELMLINIGTLILDVVFYVTLALMVSIILKNYAGAITTSIVLVIISFTLNGLFGGVLATGEFWYTLLPNMNLHLFKYFGNTFIGLGENNLLRAIMVSGIESTMGFVYSIITTCLYSLLFIIIGYSVFSKRDF